MFPLPLIRRRSSTGMPWTGWPFPPAPTPWRPPSPNQTIAFLPSRSGAADGSRQGSLRLRVRSRPCSLIPLFHSAHCTTYSVHMCWLHESRVVCHVCNILGFVVGAGWLLFAGFLQPDGSLDWASPSPCVQCSFAALLPLPEAIGRVRLHNFNVDIKTNDISPLSS